MGIVPIHAVTLLARMQGLLIITSGASI